MLGREIEEDFGPLSFLQQQYPLIFPVSPLGSHFKACFANKGETNFSPDHQSFLESNIGEKADALLLKLRLSFQSPNGCCC